MTTINISPQKLITAASHALIDAKAEYENAIQEYNAAKVYRSLADHYMLMYKIKHQSYCLDNINRIECLISAAKACDGLVCMSMEDVELVRKYL